MYHFEKNHLVPLSLDPDTETEQLD